MAEEKYLWWQTGIIYQVYPRSFCDSNNDGVGDLKGIATRLDYLQWLGIDAIWLSPVYPSPMADFGYDISDYTGIDPLFGAMEDFDALLQAVHERNMKMVIDIVPNHTSNQHPWFIESRSSRNNAKRDWYIWKEPDAAGKPPNNWLSVFGGSGWEYDDHTGQYYYHAFLKEQPDLNWRNAQIQQAMFDVMRFWLNKGVDGFRVDVMWHMIKDAQFRDNPRNSFYEPHMATYEELLPVYSTDQPEVHDIVHSMRHVLDEYRERMMIGEIYLPVEKLVTYYGTDNRGAHLPFNFQLVNLPWQARTIAAAIDQYEGSLPEKAWPNWVLGNHDQPRIVSRVGMQQARVAAILLLTLRGTPTMYYGDEIGMRDVPIPEAEIKDPQGLNMPGKNLSRDPCRTPMQWNNDTHAGFSTVQPWLRIDENYVRYNVRSQRQDENSLLWLYKRLIALRHEHAALCTGDYKPVYADMQLLVYIRQHKEGDRFLVVLNLSHRPCCYTPANFSLSGTVIIASSRELENQPVKEYILLPGDEGVVVKLEQ